jgi:predicted thioredoxin/glutaredoxin
MQPNSDNLRETTQNMAKYLSEAFFRDVFWKSYQKEISRQKMLELIEDEVIKNYNGKETNQTGEVEQGR